MDDRSVERAAQLYRLLLPRVAMTGRVGAIESRQAGASLELHDFREYQPGDDVRHLDWNAVARTGRWIVRVRREDVAPRVEIVVDASRSMAITADKRERTRELATLLARVSRAQGLESVVHWISARPQRAAIPLPDAFDANRPLTDALAKLALRPSGVRVLISDLLFDAPLTPLFRRLADGAASLAVLQVLDRGDLEPEGGVGARLLDSESDAFLDRVVSADVLARYHARLHAHQQAVAADARRFRAEHVVLPADRPLLEQIAESLIGRVLVPRGTA